LNDAWVNTTRTSYSPSFSPSLALASASLRAGFCTIEPSAIDSRSTTKQTTDLSHLPRTTSDTNCTEDFYPYLNPTMKFTVAVTALFLASASAFAPPAFVSKNAASVKPTSSAIQMA
jgi:hypothetical protein